MGAAQAGSGPLGWWTADNTSRALQPGDILRARDVDEGDAYAVVRVVGVHKVRDIEEAIVAPLLTFGANVSAPMNGDGGLLSVYDVLTAAEVAELLPAADDEPTAGQTDVAAAKAILARARVEA